MVYLSAKSNPKASLRNGLVRCTESKAGQFPEHLEPAWAWPHIAREVCKRLDRSPLALEITNVLVLHCPVLLPHTQFCTWKSCMCAAIIVCILQFALLCMNQLCWSRTATFHVEKPLLLLFWSRKNGCQTCIALRWEKWSITFIAKAAYQHSVPCCIHLLPQSISPGIYSPL